MLVKNISTQIYIYRRIFIVCFFSFLTSPFEIIVSERNLNKVSTELNKLYSLNLNQWIVANYPGIFGTDNQRSSTKKRKNV